MASLVASPHSERGNSGHFAGTFTKDGFIKSDQTVNKLCRVYGKKIFSHLKCCFRVSSFYERTRLQET